MCIMRSTRLSALSLLLLALVSPRGSTQVLAGSRAPTGSSSDIRIFRSGEPPRLMFACELDTGSLQRLFADSSVIDELQALHAGVALSLIDFSSARAEIVRRLNAADIPVDAWMALPKEQGYYINADNERQAAARFVEFQEWTAENKLRWAGIGLDIEPNIQEFAAMRDHKLRLLGTLVARYFESGRVYRARVAYAGLIRQMQMQGYMVETYQFPFIVDEREAHTTLLERLFGLVDVRGNREVLMLYSSFNHSMDSGIIWKYGAEAQVIAVGSTKSDPAFDAKFPSLNWDELSHDLRVASHFSHTVGIYSLEGCVHQGFLPRLVTMNWNQPATIPAEAVAKVNLMRSRIHWILWIGSHLPYLFLTLLFLLAVWIWRRRRSRRCLGSA